MIDPLIITEQIARAWRKCQQHGIDDQDTFNGALLLGQSEKIECLSLQLLHRVRFRKGETQSAPIRAQKHIGNDLVAFLITLMLERCGDTQVPPPPGLLRLVRVQLDADKFAAKELRAPGAFERAVRFCIAHPKASVSDIARYAGVERQAVSKWRKDGDLEKAASELKREIPLLTERPDWAVLDETTPQAK
jgi:hypothetical protein